MDLTLLDKYSSFLKSIINPNTRAYYKRVIDQYLRFLSQTRNIDFTKALGIDIILWRKDLLETGGIAGSHPGQKIFDWAGNSETTIENKTDIVSSFYNFLNKPGMNGKDPVMKINPVHSIQNRYKVVEYSNSKKIDQVTFLKLIKQIDAKSVSGLRNLALLWGYYLSGRRNSEWLTIKFKDIEWDKTPKVYNYTRKGQIHSTDEIPKNLFKILESYLIMRWGKDYRKINPDSYIFSSKFDFNKHISQRYVLKLVKVLAKKAGLNPKNICVHSLRHLHAQTYLDNGASVEVIRKRLNHKNLSTTQKYIASLKSQSIDISSQLYEKLKENDNIES